MTYGFNSWSAYNEWLSLNCEIYNITKVEEKEGKIWVEYSVK